MTDRTFEKGQSTTFEFKEVRPPLKRGEIPIFTFRDTVTFTIDCECKLTQKEKDHLKELGESYWPRISIASKEGAHAIRRALKELCSEAIDYLPASSMDARWGNTIYLRIRKHAEIKTEAEEIGDVVLIAGGVTAFFGGILWGVGQLMKGGDK